MKKRVLFFGFLMVAGCVSGLAQNKTMGVGVATPNPNAVLHVESPAGNQGFILPRLTTAQRTASGFMSVLGPADNGLLVYDTDLSTVFTWDGTEWSGPELTLPYADTVMAATDGSDLLRLVYAGSGSGTVGVAHFENANPNSGNVALWAQTNSNQPLSAAIYGLNTGTGDAAAVFRINNPASNYSAAFAETNSGSGTALGLLNSANGTALTIFNGGVKVSTNVVTSNSITTRAAAYRITSGTGDFTFAFGPTDGEVYMIFNDTGATIAVEGISINNGEGKTIINFAGTFKGL